MAQATVAFALRRYDEASAEADRSIELAAWVTNPDIHADALETTIPPYVITGRFAEARGLARRHHAVTERLSPHHRLHSVSVSLEIEEVSGDWEEVVALTARTRAAVAENLATPCIRNARDLLLCAAGAAIVGDPEEAQHLEREAEDLDMEGYEYILETPRLRLALARNELDVVERMTRLPFVVRRQIWFYTAAVITHLDALAALRDRGRAEPDATRFLQPGTVLEPFALRTLGIVREDETLIEQAATRFQAFGLGWHARQTSALL